MIPLAYGNTMFKSFFDRTSFISANTLTFKSSPLITVKCHYLRVFISSKWGQILNNTNSKLWKYHKNGPFKWFASLKLVGEWSTINHQSIFSYCQYSLNDSKIQSVFGMHSLLIVQISAHRPKIFANKCLLSI